MLPVDLEAQAQILASHPDYRVTRRLVVRDVFSTSTPSTIARGAVVDTETTGTDPLADQVLEVAILVFEFDPATGEVLRVVDVYSGLEDPGRPIPPESTAIHGITNEMVAGKRIDDEKVAAVLAGVSIVIAHNAGFDRPFLERRLPVFASIPWACSFAQVDWKAEGFGAGGLEFLAYRSGFFYDAHRADIDCRALLEVMNRPLPVSGTRPLAILQESLSRTDWRVYAVGAAFETKDILKARGYRWDPGQKLWHQTLSESDMSAEIAWLKAEVYKRSKVTLDFEALDAVVRFSGRSGKRGRKEV